MHILGSVGMEKAQGVAQGFLDDALADHDPSTTMNFAGFAGHLESCLGCEYLSHASEGRIIVVFVGIELACCLPGQRPSRLETCRHPGKSHSYVGVLNYRSATLFSIASVGVSCLVGRPAGTECGGRGLDYALFEYLLRVCQSCIRLPQALCIGNANVREANRGIVDSSLADLLPDSYCFKTRALSWDKEGSRALIRRTIRSCASEDHIEPGIRTVRDVALLSGDQPVVRSE